MINFALLFLAAVCMVFAFVWAWMARTSEGERLIFFIAWPLAVWAAAMFLASGGWPMSKSVMTAASVSLTGLLLPELQRVVRFILIRARLLPSG